MKGVERFALSNQGGNTIVGISKVVDEMEDEMVIVYKSTDIP